MTVLLIDGAGNKREFEVTALVDPLLVPIPQRLSVVYDSAPPASASIAEFRLTDEWSYPPVYRDAGVR